MQTLWESVCGVMQDHSKQRGLHSLFVFNIFAYLRYAKVSPTYLIFLVVRKREVLARSEIWNQTKQHSEEQRMSGRVVSTCSPRFLGELTLRNTRLVCITMRLMAEITHRGHRRKKVLKQGDSFKKVLADKTKLRSWSGGNYLYFKTVSRVKAEYALSKYQKYTCTSTPLRLNNQQSILLTFWFVIKQ